MGLLYGFYVLVPVTLVFGVRWLQRAGKSRRFLVLAGSVYWLALWTTYYVVVEAVIPRANLADAIFVLLAAAVVHLLILVVLPLARLPWTALGYFTSAVLNLGGQFVIYNLLMNDRQILIGNITYLTPYIRDLSSALMYLVESRPFFLPVTYGV